MIPITKQEALALVHIPEADLFQQAAALRHEVFGNNVELCAIINARSGHCSMNCAFCSQSIYHHTKAPTFELLSAAKIQERLALLMDYPLRRMGIVTSGGALPWEDVESLAKIIEALPLKLQKRICASLGKLSPKAFDLLKNSGLSRYHHNLETSSTYYPKVCTTQTWDARLNTVLNAKKTPLQVCAGGIFGLGESWEDRIHFALTLREHKILHVPINFLHPHEGTPLARQKPLSAGEALRIIAIFRHVLPKATLRVCGGRPLVLGHRQYEIFAAGANALMTGNYLTTKGNGIEEDCKMLTNQNLEIVTC